MRIGHYVSQIAVMKGYERNVSGHIQVPLHAMKLLRATGHDVCLITNEPPAGFTMPAFLDEGTPVFEVADGRRRGSLMTRTGGHTSGIRPIPLVRQVRQILDVVKREKLDVVHFWGFTRTAQLAGMLRALGMRPPAVATMFGAKFGRWFPFSAAMMQRVDRYVSSTNYVYNALEARGLHGDVVRHGPIRDLLEEHDGSQAQPKHRVLFWRDPSVSNGADVVLHAYERLAPKYPDISFDMALRPHWLEIDGIDALAQRIPNVHVHRFPYPPGVTLPRLMLESLCVLMPIRDMSINPQLVIAESMAAGVPVIATDQRSNPELITPGRNGDLVPIGDARATTDALDRMLSDRGRLLEMGANAAADIASKWNWDRFAEELVAVYARVRAGS